MGCLAVFLLLCTALISFQTRHTEQAMRAFNRTCIPPDSIPGMSEPGFFLETDTYTWLSHTRDLLNVGGWRLRHTYMDNAPYGREMHWSHLLIWSLAGLAKTVQGLQPPDAPLPIARALETAGIWVMPIWQWIFIGVGFFPLARKLGLLPAMAFALAMICFESIASAFFPLKADHHAYQMMFIAMAFASLLLGGLGRVRNGESPDGGDSAPGWRWIRFPAVPDFREARRWFLAAGIWGGLACWIGATVWLFALALTALAVLPSLPMFRRDVALTGRHRRNAAEATAYRPELWLWWGGAGVLSSVVFYLLEYAPSHFSMRLEVNHPFHWLAWAGVALGLTALGRLEAPFRLRNIFRSRLFWAGGALAAVLPLVLWLGPADWHQLKDPLLQRLHHHFIIEFAPSPNMAPGHFHELLLTYRLPVLTLLLVPAFLWIPALRLPEEPRRILRSAWLWAVFFLVAISWQVRWGFLCGIALWLLALLGAAAVWTDSAAGKTAARGRRWLIAGLALLTAADAGWGILSRTRLENRIATAEAIPESWIQNNVKKRLALRWGLAMGSQTWRFAGTAPVVSLIYYYTGIPGVASFYWENAAGWHAETALMADTTPHAETARAICKERGLTHLMSSVPSDYPLLYNQVATGNTNHYFAATQTLCGHLTYAPFPHRPSWMDLDGPLTEIGTSETIFKTPAKYAKEKAKWHIFALSP